MIQPNPRITRIRRVSTLVLIPMIAFLIYFPIRPTWHLIQAAFVDPQKFRWWFYQIEIAPDMPMSTRLIVFAINILPILAGIWALIAGIALMHYFRQGHYFRKRNAMAAIHAGLACIIMAATQIICRSFNGYLLTLHNSENHFPLRLFWDTYDVGYLLAGCAFVIVGWVTREAVLIQEENEAFV